MFIAYLNYRNKADLPKEMLNSGGLLHVVKEYNIEGVARACNTAIKDFFNTPLGHGLIEYITIIANDIVEPPGWMKHRFDFMESNPHVGICSIAINNPGSLQSQDLIGNFTIRRSLFFKIGLFDESFDPYGPIDLDYCHRAQAVGFKTCYIPELIAHTGEHGNGNDYGYDKKEMVEKNWGKLVKDYDRFDKGEGIFINESNGYIIDFNEWPELL